MDIGKTLQKVRKGKNISQEELSKGIVSRSHLSFIENGKHDISIELFIQLVNKLHIPIEEFFYLSNNCSISEKKEISLRLMNAANKGSFSELKELQKYLGNELEISNNDYEYHHYYLLIELYMHLLSNSFIIDEKVHTIVKPIKDYLFGLSDWYLYDLKLFNNILFTFKTIDVEALSEMLFLSIEKYQAYSSARDDYLNILINISTYFNDQEYYESSLKFAKLGKEKTQKEYRIYENIILDINLAVANIKLMKDIKNNKNLLKNRLFLMESLDLIDLKKHYEILIRKYKISL